MNSNAVNLRESIVESMFIEFFSAFATGNKASVKMDLLQLNPDGKTLQFKAILHHKHIIDTLTGSSTSYDEHTNIEGSWDLNNLKESQICVNTPVGTICIDWGLFKPLCAGLVLSGSASSFDDSISSGCSDILNTNKGRTVAIRFVEIFSAMALGNDAKVTVERLELCPPSTCKGRADIRHKQEGKVLGRRVVIYEYHTPVEWDFDLRNPAGSTIKYCVPNPIPRQTGELCITMTLQQIAELATILL